MLTYDSEALARLEKLYSAPQIVDQRRRLRAILTARPGETGLDVGCGVAYLACELAKEVTPGGRIAAIDSSRDAVDASKLRIANEQLVGQVDVGVGDAAHLDFPDNTFDFVVGAQVYCYVPDLPRALGEAARVLRKWPARHSGHRLGYVHVGFRGSCPYSPHDRGASHRSICARACST